MAGASAKASLLPVQIVTAGDMSGNVITTPTNVQGLDSLVFQAIWTGSPTGSFAVEISENYRVGSGGTVLNAGNWVPLSLTGTVSASGSGDDAIFDLDDIPPGWLRLNYTAVSGTGSLNVYVAGKSR